MWGMAARGSNLPKVAPLVAAVTLLGAVGTVGAVGVLNRDDGAGAGATSTSVAVSAETVSLVTTTLPPTTTTIPKTTIAQPLSKGMAGPEVQRLQERLQQLGFQPGPIDGQFGDLTQMAVWAYQKLVMDVGFKDPDGVVTPDMWLALQDPLPVHARRPEAGRHTEIILPKQVLVVFDGDTPLFISHISSGELAEPGDDFNAGKEWCEEVTIDPGESGNETGTEPIKQGVCGNAWTPGRGLRLRPQGRGQAREPPRRDAQPRLLQLRHRRARRLQRAARARLARLHPHPQPDLADVLQPRQHRRAGVRVRRRQGARGLRLAVGAVGLEGPQLHDDDDVDDHDDHDDGAVGGRAAGAGRDAAAGDDAAGHDDDGATPGGPARQPATGLTGAAQVGVASGASSRRIAASSAGRLLGIMWLVAISR